MTTDTDTPELPPELPAGTTAESDAAFEAGFSGVREEPQAPTETPAAPAAPDAPAAEDSAVAAPGKQEEPADETNQEIIPGIGLTNEQLRASLSKVEKLDGMSKQIDRLFGTLGDLQQKMTQGQPVTKAEKEATAQAFKRVHEEYPELAAVLAEDMKEAMASATPVDIDGVVNQRLAEKIGEIREAFEIKLVAMQHKDWQEQIQSPDFSLWLQTLPEQRRNDVVNSADSAVVIDAVSSFKDWKAAVVKRGDTTQRNKKRLEDALVPEGTGRAKPVSQSEQQAFESGFQAVRGR